MFLYKSGYTILLNFSNTILFFHIWIIKSFLNSFQNLIIVFSFYQKIFAHLIPFPKPHANIFFILSLKQIINSTIEKDFLIFGSFKLSRPKISKDFGKQIFLFVHKGTNFSDSTGFAAAAFIAWKLIAANAITKAIPSEEQTSTRLFQSCTQNLGAICLWNSMRPEKQLY